MVLVTAEVERKEVPSPWDHICVEFLEQGSSCINLALAFIPHN